MMRHMGNVAVPLLDLHGGRVMGHMGNRAHEHKDQVDGVQG